MKKGDTSMSENPHSIWFAKKFFLKQLKTIKVKEILKRGEIKTINEAVEKMGLSRSAYYKYKDFVSRSMKQARKKLLPCPYCWSTNPVCCPRS